MLRLTIVANNQLILGVDSVLAVCERELEHLGLGNRLRRAGFDTQVAVNTPQVIDLVDEAVTFAGRYRIIDRVVGAPHINAVGRTDTSA